ncbi:MAG: glycosyltransferase [Spirochaetes bacterium]|nr:glycosyltransferase [Spirochaetota bacterium]
MDTISIITPSFNQGCFLDDAISSVLSQSGEFYIDYIIIDGGSTDTSVSVIKKYEEMLQENCKTVQMDGLTYYIKKKPAFRFCNCRGISYRWISEKDEGQSHAINKGISMMEGDFFAWINSDDYYMNNDVFAKAVDFFKAHPNTGMIYGRGYCVDEHKKIMRDFHDNCTTLNFSRSILKHECFILQPAVFVRSAVVRDAGPLDESFQWCMDWEYWLRIARKHTISYFPQWVACWRQYEGIKSNDFCRDTVYERDRIMRKYSGFFEYAVNRWYFQATMFSLQHLASLRHDSPIKKTVICGFELAANYTLRLFMRMFGGKRVSSTVSRIAIFTPLEPINSDIAKYNTGLIQGLLKKKPGLFVDVYVDGGYNPIRFESPGFRIINHEKFHRNHYIYDTILFKVGDDYRHHSYMFPYVRRYGGIVELDDAKLNQIYIHIIEKIRGYLRKRKLLSCLRLCAAHPELRYYAWHKMLRPLSNRNKEAYLDRYLYRKSFLVKKARSIIVRDQNPVLYYRLPRRKCSIIEKGSEINSLTGPQDNLKIRKRFDIPKNAFVMILGGETASMVKADLIIKALARIRKQVPDLLCILMADHSRQNDALVELIRECRLEKRVRFSGELTNEEKLEYISIADAGIDLGSKKRKGQSGFQVDLEERGKIVFMPGFGNDRSLSGDLSKWMRRKDDVEKVLADRMLWLYNNPGHVYRIGFHGHQNASKAPKLNDAVITGYCEALGL